MFADDEKKHPAGLVRKGQDGLWGIHYETPQYRAWRYWLTKAFGREYFGNNWLTVWGQWPPTSQIGADAVAAAISALRDTPEGRYGVIGGKLVPRHPEPWDGYVPPSPESMRMLP